MANKELFNQTTQTTIPDAKRLAFGEPGQDGCENIEFSDLKTQILSSVVSGYDCTVGTSGDYATFAAAYTAGKRRCLQISNVTESSDVIATTNDRLYIYGNGIFTWSLTNYKFKYCDVHNVDIRINNSVGNEYNKIFNSSITISGSSPSFFVLAYSEMFITSLNLNTNSTYSYIGGTWFGDKSTKSRIYNAGSGLVNFYATVQNYVIDASTFFCSMTGCSSTLNLAHTGSMIDCYFPNLTAANIRYNVGRYIFRNCTFKEIPDQITIETTVVLDNVIVGKKVINAQGRILTVSEYEEITISAGNLTAATTMQIPADSNIIGYNHIITSGNTQGKLVSVGRTGGTVNEFANAKSTNSGSNFATLLSINNSVAVTITSTLDATSTGAITISIEITYQYTK